jgi:alpha-glucosidase
MTDTEWWRGAVIYQIYPRSFYDSNGDGVGDLAGILQKIDYVAALGVDAIWISPFFASPMRDFGYDVSDYVAVDPVFGTLADFDRIIEAAHGRGIKVLIDQVWAHTSDRHPWFLDSRSARHGPRSDWYVWADPKPDGMPPNNWLSVFGGSAWQWEPRRRQYYLHHFLASQPKLNLRNPAVLDALLAAGAFWLERGVDGFRLDAVDFFLHDALLRDNPPRPLEGPLFPAKLFGVQRHLHDMMQPEVRPVIREIRRLMDRYPGTVTLAEVSSQEGALARIAYYTAGREALHMAYTLQPLRGAFDRENLSRLIAQLAQFDPAGWIAWSFSNHDVERVVTRWGRGISDPAFARLLMGLLLSLGGSACVYQGEELGLPNSVLAFEDLRDPYGLAYYPEFCGRDGSRTPLPWRADAPHAGFTTAARPWLPVDAAHYPLAVDRQQADPSSHLANWRRFIAWRKRHPALLHGRIEPIDVAAPLLAFRRASAAESLIVVLNIGKDPAPLPQRLMRRGRLLDGHGFALLGAAGSPVLPGWGMGFLAEAAPP